MDYFGRDLDITLVSGSIAVLTVVITWIVMAVSYGPVGVWLGWIPAIVAGGLAFYLWPTVLLVVLALIVRGMN